MRPIGFVPAPVAAAPTFEPELDPARARRRVTVTVERFGDNVRTSLEAADVELADAPAVAAELEAAIASAIAEAPGLTPTVAHVGGDRFEIVDEDGGGRYGRVVPRSSRTVR